MPHAVLDQILSAIVVDVKAFAVCEFAADCAIEIRPLDEIEIHFVLAGTLHLTLGNGEVFPVMPGGVVLVPPHTCQRMGASPEPSRLFRPADICTTRPDGLMQFDATQGRVGSVHVICGLIRADVGGSFGPFDGLRTPIRAALSDEPMVALAFETMLREAGAVSLGSRAMIGALMKACFIAALRRYADRNGAEGMLPGLFARPSLARAVAMIVADPSARHTLADLARSAGMSRSKFAKTFTETIDISPMDFVARTRLARARELVVATELSVSAIAAQVGFTNRSHFSRAFRQAFGIDPRGLRRRTLAPAPETADA